MANIYFSHDEIDFLTDLEIFPLKRSLLERLSLLFIEIEQNLNLECSNNNFLFPEGVLIKKGKISKGDNYNNQPYLVLDYPRLLEKNNIFCLRTIFWWGNYFSNAFILSGSMLDRYQNSLIDNFLKLKNTEWYFSINKDPWKLEISKENYIKVKNLDKDFIENHVRTFNYIKIAGIYPISEYKKLSDTSVIFFKNFLDILQ